MRLFKLFIFSGIILFIASQYIYAQQPNPDFYGGAGKEVSGTYIVTIKKMEISQDGNTFITIGDREMSFNIASGDVGNSIGNYVSNSSLPAGTYTTMRITLSRTITIKGQGENSGNIYYTTTRNGTTSGDFYKATTDPTQYEAVSFQVPAEAQGGADEVMEIIGDDMRVTKDFVNPIVVTKGATQSISVSFNTQRMIGFESAGADYFFYPMPPEQSAQ